MLIVPFIDNILISDMDAEGRPRPSHRVEAVG